VLTALMASGLIVSMVGATVTPLVIGGDVLILPTAVLAWDC
jgi:hypothetical protein